MEPTAFAARRRLVGLLTFAVAAATCDPVAEPDTPLFTLAVAEAGLRVENTDDEARWFIAIDAESLGLVDLDFDPVNEPLWTRVQPSGTAVIPWEKVLLYQEGTSHFRVVSWTRSVQIEGPDGPRWVADRIQWLEIQR